MKKDKENVHASIDAGEIIKEHMSTLGKKGMKSRWGKSTPEERRERMKHLEEYWSRKKKLSTDVDLQ